MGRFKWVGLLAVVAGLGGIAGTGGAVALESNDQFCAACHTEPETTYVAQLDEARATDAAPTLAAFHGAPVGPLAKSPGMRAARCVDCHSGPHPADRATTLVKAAGDTVEFFLGTARQPARLEAPLPDVNCTKCHVDDYAADQSFVNHFHTLLTDPEAPKDMRCVECHVSHQPASDISQFAILSVVFPACERCHEFMGRGPTKMQRRDS